MSAARAFDDSGWRSGASGRLPRATTATASMRSTTAKCLEPRLGLFAPASAGRRVICASPSRKEPTMTTELRERLEREASLVHAAPDAKALVLDRAERRIRLRRIEAGMLGLLVALAVIGSAVSILPIGA